MDRQRTSRTAVFVMRKTAEFRNSLEVFKKLISTQLLTVLTNCVIFLLEQAKTVVN